MNTALIKETIAGSINGTMKFPQTVQSLVTAGIESYHVDLVRGENRYYMASGDSCVEKVPLHHPAAAQQFSAARVEAAVRASQSGKINYRQFVDLISEAGCVFYIAYLSGRRVTYFGREGDSHTEFFPR